MVWDEKNGMLVADVRVVAVGLYCTAGRCAGKRHYRRLYHHGGRDNDYHRYGAVLRLAERCDLCFCDENDDNGSDRGIRLVGDDVYCYCYHYNCYNSDAQYHYDHTAGKAGR